MDGIHLGIDVGSTTVKFVVLDESSGLRSHQYLRSRGKPRGTLLGATEVLARRFPGAPVLSVGLTGSGGAPIARLVGGWHVNELVAQTRAIGVYHPEARTVIEIGGQDSKFLSVRWDESLDQMTLEDFGMNALCAAGTGAFLDQQAERLGIAIDEEFAAVAMSSESPARVAGRCTVFAKSDMIHLQQEGTPIGDILAGLCLAMARNYRSIVGRGKCFRPPILFQGGVANNEAVARAFQQVLGLEAGELIIPEHRNLMAAIGAGLLARDELAEGRVHPFAGFEPLRASVEAGEHAETSLPVLPEQQPAPIGVTFSENGMRPIPTYLGVDVGSISTNAVLIDAQDRVVSRVYLPTAGRPIRAARQALEVIGRQMGPRVKVLAAGSTGSGRHLVGHYVGADVVRNEITAQARAAVAVDPDVDTVFEIGGQDSKYIRLQDGAVVDFAMNNACAAGTGSFLEEQADRLEISIEDEFASLALGAPCPSCLGDRCTVFMESDLLHHQQRGSRVENLTAGLAYSIVHNYLNRVVNTRPLGRRILFQGGVAANDAVASAFHRVTGRTIRVPPHYDVTGAIGVAILAREDHELRNGYRTRFRGFSAIDVDAEAKTFICRACTNLCEVKRVQFGDDPPIFYGARCDRFEDAGRKKARSGREIPDLFAEREELLLRGYDPGARRRTGRPRVGVPRALIFHELFPFWRAFFDDLGMDVVLSSETNPDTVSRTQQQGVIESCFPIKLVFGHVLELAESDVDYVFLPSIANREDPSPNQPHCHYCPLIPAVPHMVTAHIDVEAMGPRVLRFSYHMRERQAERRELRELAGQLGMPTRRLIAAADVGRAALAEFKAAVRARGQAVLDGLPEGQPAVVLVGRPYNTADKGVSQDLPHKLRKLGVLVIPMDYIGGSEVDISDVHRDMYWRSGQEILGAGRIIANDERLQAIYLTSFDCGPDSFLISYFRRVMGSKPFLELELDDHTAEAGMITRCEAFLDSLGVRAEEVIA